MKIKDGYIFTITSFVIALIMCVLILISEMKVKDAIITSYEQQYNVIKMERDSWKDMFNECKEGREIYNETTTRI